MRYLILILLSFSSLFLFAQQEEQEEVLAQRQRWARSEYYNLIQPNQLLLSGRNYYREYPKTGGHQYYDSKTYSVNPLKYDGVSYENVALNYDIFNQEMVTITYQDGKVIYMQLDISRVDEFYLNEDKFIQIQGIDGMEEGIYQEAYSNKDIRFLIRRNKERSKLAQVDYLKYRYRFNSKNEYFLMGSWGSREIKSKKDLLELLPAEASTIVDEQGLRLKPNAESYIEEVIELLEAVAN